MHGPEGDRHEAATLSRFQSGSPLDADWLAFEVSQVGYTRIRHFGTEFNVLIPFDTMIARGREDPVNVRGARVAAIAPHADDELVIDQNSGAATLTQRQAADAVAWPNGGVAGWSNGRMAGCSSGRMAGWPARLS